MVLLYISITLLLPNPYPVPPSFCTSTYWEETALYNPDVLSEWQVGDFKETWRGTSRAERAPNMLENHTVCGSTEA